ncbi:long-chain-fatty-acid--CoA ligase [Desulfoluna limicola]|uniref:Long-chain-fatty-acid--CoA ligase n=1 Tax=Desulfoluna limicola TaxID=2810562 RepID=A0ABN6F5J8_9BACT|nr:AMP-binding protein [Desulfoluna limicola]BCS97018.1 long-chain-fatty-acid--CoA ligase [Desulfoluna limicola]
MITCADKPWLANYDTGVPPTLDYHRLSLPQMFQNSVGRHPRNTALIYQGHHITYAELQVLVRTFAITLTTLGVKKGDVVGIWLPNTVPAVVAYYAALTMGAVVLMCNPHSSNQEMLQQMNDADARLLITQDILAERAIGLRRETHIQTIIHASLEDYLPSPLKWIFPLVAKKQGLSVKVPEHEGVYSWSVAMDLKGTPIPEPVIHPDEVAVYLSAGGPSGRTRGALLTHANLTTMVQMYEAWLQLDKEKERVLASPPIFRTLGMSAAMNLPIHMGWSTVLVPTPNPEKILEAIRKFKPTMYMGGLEDNALPKTDITTSKPLPPSAPCLPAKRFHRFKELTGISIIEGYSVTETTPQTHLPPFKGLKKAGSIGIPFPDTEVRIMDIETGTRELGVGEQGEMWFRGPQISFGHLEGSNEDSPGNQEKWLKSGDIAWMDEDGYFYVVGRKKSLTLTSAGHIAPKKMAS